MADFADRKLKWKLREIIALLKPTRDCSAGPEGKNCCWKNRVHPGICRLLPMEAIKLVISEVMSFVYSDSFKTGKRREKVIAK